GPCFGGTLTSRRTCWRLRSERSAVGAQRSPQSIKPGGWRMGAVASSSRAEETLERGARLSEAALTFLPQIRHLARPMEMARRLDDVLVEAMEAAGLFSVIVPKRWGG